MKPLLPPLFLVLYLLPALTCAAVDMPLEFTDEAQEQRYLDLTTELRCLVCQNQSLADSDSGLANDLRLEIYQMMMSGKDDAAIIDYLVYRYGDFVLYRPPFKLKTVLLWIGPLLFLATGILIAGSVLRRKPGEVLAAEKHGYAKEMLKQELPEGLE